MYGWSEALLGLAAFPIGLAAAWFTAPLADRLAGQQRAGGSRGPGAWQWAILALVAFCALTLPLLRFVAMAPVESPGSAIVVSLVAPALSIWLPGLFAWAGGMLSLEWKLGAILSAVLLVALIAAGLPFAGDQAIFYGGSGGRLRAALADAWPSALIMLACLWVGAAVRLAHHRTMASTRRSDATLVP
jgi:hypothetical protein